MDYFCFFCWLFSSALPLQQLFEMEQPLGCGQLVIFHRRHGYRDELAGAGEAGWGGEGSGGEAGGGGGEASGNGEAGELGREAKQQQREGEPGHGGHPTKTDTR